MGQKGERARPVPETQDMRWNGMDGKPGTRAPALTQGRRRERARLWEIRPLVLTPQKTPAHHSPRPQFHPGRWLPENTHMVVSVSLTMTCGKRQGSTQAGEPPNSCSVPLAGVGRARLTQGSQEKRGTPGRPIPRRETQAARGIQSYQGEHISPSCLVERSQYLQEAGSINTIYPTYIR